MLTVFRALSLTEYCASPAELEGLPNKTQQTLRKILADHYRNDPSEDALWLLLLVSPLPETELASPSEQIEWLGHAALRQHPDPYRYAMGRLRNRQQQQQRRQTRDQGFVEEPPGEVSVIARLEAIDEWEELTPDERQFLIDSAQGTSREELSRRWGLTAEGIKTRLRRLRKKLNDL